VSDPWYDLSPLQPSIGAGAVLLTPNQRLARRLRLEWDTLRAADGARAWEPLPAFPLEQWLQGEWDRAQQQGRVPPVTPLERDQELELWRRVIAADELRSGSYHLLRPAAAAELACQARDLLLRWEVDVRDPATRQEFTLDPDCAVFLRWLESFGRQLATAGQCTAVDCIVQLAASNWRTNRASAVLVEFEDVPPLLQRTLRTLCPAIGHHAQGGPEGELAVHAFDAPRSELAAAARWLRDSHRQEPEAKLAVILTDMAVDREAFEYLLRREFGCLDRGHGSLPVNFSTGVALDRVPLVRDALAALALGGRTTTVPAVQALMRSRFLQLPDADGPLAALFLRRLHETGREELPVRELRFQAASVALGGARGLVLGRHLETLAASPALQGTAAVSDWARRFAGVLEQWGWPGTGALDSLEFQQLAAWQQLLERFAALDGVCGPVGYEAALQLLRRCCSRAVAQPQTLESRLQVLGPLEAAGLSFDRLWVVGMQAGSWPAAARPHPFIPHALQRQRQMPNATAERQWQFAAGLFRRYRRGTRLLHASFCRARDGAPELPSPLLGDVVARQDMPPGPAAGWVPHRQPLEAIEDHRAPPVADGAAAGGSALLEDQSGCPFRAFARHRLAAEPLPGFRVAPPAARRGTLLHDALFALWGEIGDHATLVGLEESARQAAVTRAVQAALLRVPAPLQRWPGTTYWQLEVERLEALLLEWLAVEARRSAFVVAAREQATELPLDRLQLRLRVDRIDRLPDGGRIIIDYKSGEHRVGEWLGERPAQPQLLLYGIAEPDGLAALAFARLRPGDCGFTGLGESAVAPGVETDIPAAVRQHSPARDWVALNREWRVALQQLAARFVAGDARVDPRSPTTCARCGLQALCRVDLPQGDPT